jgi:heat shock protein HtpX
MWEAIRQNTFRSRLLAGLLGAILVAAGFFIGLAVDPRAGGPIGVVGALGLWLVLYLFAIFQGDSVLLLSARAHRIAKEDAPQLWNVVEEMTIAAGLPAMPAIYAIEDEAPNAFAVGSRPQKATVAVTTGLLRRLDRDELQGVIAHEIGHIANLDIRFMTMASVMLGTILILSDIFLRSMWFGGGRRRRNDSDSGQIVFLIVGILVAILAPIAAQLLYFAASRKREYLADASSARFTRYPEGLARALEKIAAAASSTSVPNRAVAPLLTVNPLQAAGTASTVFSTHPPTESRIRVLRAMGGGAGLPEYQAAFQKVQGSGARIIGLRSLTGAPSIPARPPMAPAQAAAEAADRFRDVGRLLNRMDDLVPIPCPCGLTMKIPAGFSRPAVTCARCGREHEVPRAGPADAGPAGGGPPGPLPPAGEAPPLRYRRKGTDWESLRCDCGKLIELSPLLRSPAIRCPACRRTIEIVPAA